MIKIQATSFTTGSKKWFILSNENYKKRFTHYPAWSFDESTKTTNIYEEKQSSINLKPCLTVEQQAHNERNKQEIKMRDDEYEYDLALAKKEQKNGYPMRIVLKPTLGHIEKEKKRTNERKT